MRDRTLGVRLELITQFQTAAKSAVTELRTVVTGLEEVKKAGAKSNLTGISELTAAVDRLSKRIDSSLGSISAMGQATTSVGAKARTAAIDVDTLGAAAARTGQKANAAAAALGRLGTSMNIGSAISIDRAGTALTGMAREAISARRAVDELRSSLNALPTTKVTRVSVEGGGYNQTALPSGQSGNARWAQAGPMQMPMSLPGETQRALSGGRTSSNLALSPYGGEGMRNVTPGAALTGGTDPYDVRNQDFNNRVWNARNRANNPGDFGGGPPISVPPGGAGGPGEGGFSGANFGNGLKSAGQSMRGAGQQLTGVGFGAGMAGSLGLGALFPMLKSAMDAQDLEQTTVESLLSSTHMSKDQGQRLVSRLSESTGKYGGDFKQNMGAQFRYVSSLPTDVQAQMSDNRVRNQTIEGFDRIVKGAAIGGSSQDPVNANELALNVNETSKNLFNSRNSDEFFSASKVVTNSLINLKNNYDTTASNAARALMAVGTIAKLSGVKAEDVFGIIAIAASTGSFGNKAGNDARRIIQRQGQDPKPLRTMEEFLLQKYHADISMFDQKGNARSPLDMVGTIAKFQKQHHVSDKDRLYMNTTVAGSYASKTYASLIDHYNQHGSLDELHSIGRNVMYGVPDAKKPGDALNQSHINRQDAKMSLQELDGKYNAELLKTFRLIEPEFLKFLTSLNGLIAGFSKLDPQVKKFIVGFVAIGSVALATIGVLGIIAGSILAIGGALTMLAGSAFGGMLTSIGEGFASLGGFVARAAVLFAGPFASAIRIGLAVLGPLAGLILSPIGAFVALTAAAVLLYTAWTHNWLGIRDVTHNAVNFVAELIPKVATSIGYMTGQVVRYLAGVIPKVGQFIGNMALTVTDGLKACLGKIASFAGYFRDHGAQLIYQMSIGWMFALPSVFAKMGDAVSRGLSYLGGIWNKGAAAFNLGLKSEDTALNASVTHHYAASVDTDKFANSSMNAVPKAVKAATIAPVVIDKAPAYVGAGSYGAPPDVSGGGGGGGGGGGTGGGGDDTHDFFNGLRNGTLGKKAKKAKKPKVAPMDNTLLLEKGETIAQIESTARAIETALLRGGARIKMGYIDLYDAMSGKSTRVHGNAAAFRLAIKQDKGKKEDFVQESGDIARDFLGGTINEKTAQAALVKIKKIISGHYAEIGRHGLSEINKMESAIQKKLAGVELLMGKGLFGKDGVTGTNKKVKSEFDSEDDKSRRFNEDAGRSDDKLRRKIDLRKNQELPTLKELRAEREIEISESNKLQDAYNLELTERKRIVQSIIEMEAETRAVTGTDRVSVDIRKRATEATQEYRHQLSNLDDDLDQQREKINAVTASVGKYNTAIVQGKSGNSQWAALLTSSFDTASKQALDGAASTFSSAIDGFVEKILGSKGKKGSPFQAAIGTFVGSFVKSMLDGMIKSMLDGMQGQLHGFFSNLGTGNGFFSKIFKGGSREQAQSADAAGMTTADLPNAVSQIASVVNTTMKSNLDLNSPLDKTLKMNLGKGGLFDQVLGKFSKDVISPIGGSSQTAAGAAVSGGITDNVGATERQIAGSAQFQNIERAAKQSIIARGAQGIGGAYAAYEGFKTGGVQGGIEAGIGVLNTIKAIAPNFGPWGQAIAAAAAVTAMLIHHDSPDQMPDKYDGRRFTDIQAELLGNNSHASGYVRKTDLFNDPVLQETGGVGLLKYIQDYLKSGGAGLSPDQLKDYKADFGTTGGGLKYDKNINQESVVGGGLKGSYLDINTAATGAAQAILKLKGASITAAQNAATLAASFTALILGGPAGFAIPLAVTGAGHGGSMLSAPGATGDVRHSPISTPPMVNAPNPRASIAPISIRVLEGAHIANGDPQAIAAMVGAMMPGIINQIRRTNYQDQRLYSRYTPLTS